jgi:putative salt-induced outer membrane protein YdiY
MHVVDNCNFEMIQILAFRVAGKTVVVVLQEALCNITEEMLMKLKYILFLLVGLVVSNVFAAVETNEWSSRVGFGLNLSRATADTTQLNGDFSLSHKTKHHEFLHTLNAVYGETDSEKSENNVNALLQWNQNVTSDSYLYGNSTFRYDDIANIDYRVLIGGGVGYYFVQHNMLLVAVETGPSYLVEQFRLDDDSADAENYDDKNNELMWRVAQRYKQAVGDASKLWESVEYIIGLGDTEKYLFNFSVGIDVPVNSHFDLRISLDDKYDGEPAPNTDSNNLSMRVALVYRLL